MASLRQYLGNVRAPEFPTDVEWLNTTSPLSLTELRGKFVLLDFWTYGCINCMHVIPDLKRLEERFADELVVIGVHSAKFANERNLENIRQIVLRYGLEHPVVNDREMRIWQQFAVRAWPSTVLIDPTGRVIAAHSGEGVWQTYADLLERAVKDYGERGLLQSGRLELVTETERAPASALSYPGKIAIDKDGTRLFIADSSHHRIVICNLDGTVLTVIGSGEPGLRDGSYREARFAKPQGMALKDGILYVADTENHALRTIDLAAKQVRTLAGDGQISYDEPSGTAQTTRLNSPWDLAWLGDRLYIAMAGRHQLWVFDLERDELRVFAGSGREALFDGSLQRAAMAQPSGLASDGRDLYVADSEASAIRRISLSEGSVHTLVGEGLFEFGDIDGSWPEARLQHALGVAWHAGLLYIADTYNHKIKVLDLASGRVSTFVGDGQPGWCDGEHPRFYEPGGLAVHAGQLYVADTNNHVIRVIDLASRDTRTLGLRDPQGLLAGHPRSGRRITSLGPFRMAPGKALLEIRLVLPRGHKLNSQAPSRWVWEMSASDVVHLKGDAEIDLVASDGRVHTEVELRDGQATLEAQLTAYYCATEKGLCLIELGQVELVLDVMSESQGHTLEIELPIPLKRTRDS